MVSLAWFSPEHRLEIRIIIMEPNIDSDSIPEHEYDNRRDDGKPRHRLR